MTEHNEQVAVFEWARMQRNIYPELDLLYAVPNGGKRDVITAKRMQDEGVKPGVPDICLPVARGGYNALYVELKRPASANRTKGRVSEKQGAWLQLLSQNGNKACVCYGASEAIRTIREYLGGEKQCM